MSSPTPLPELETQLVDAARRLDSAEAGASPRRRWWRHGWSLVAIALAGIGTSVAVARVAEVGPFAYLGRYTGMNPKLAPTSVITVQPAGLEPAWQARAHLDRLGQLCITGGSRDLRTNPDPRPVNGKRNDPPPFGSMCADSDEIAQMLVDPDWPGSTFAGSAFLDGRVPNTGRAPEGDDRPTRVLVYGVAAAGVRPVAQWVSGGPAHELRPSNTHLRMTVDKSPRGLDARERHLVASYPDELDLTLWAAELEIPPGVENPQVIFPSEFAPHGVPDGTIELAGIADIRRLIRENKAKGWKYQRHIGREAPPVEGETASQRKRIAAFARARTGRDAVPQRFRSERHAWERVQYAASRRLSIAGGGIDAAWVAPGGAPESLPFPVGQDRVCILGASILGQCKGKPRNPKRPIVETVLCSPSLNRTREHLVWALSPPGASRVTVTGPGVRAETIDAAELIAVRRPRGERVASLTWTWPSGRDLAVRAPWPKRTPRCGNTSPGWSEYRLDSDGSSSMGGGPRANRPKSTP